MMFLYLPDKQMAINMNTVARIDLRPARPRLWFDTASTSGAYATEAQRDAEGLNLSAADAAVIRNALGIPQPQEVAP